MPRAKKGQEKVLILKKTTGLCPSRSYYSIIYLCAPSYPTRRRKVSSLVKVARRTIGEVITDVLIKCGEHLQRWARTSFRDALSPFALFKKVRAHIFDPRKWSTSGVKYPFVSGVFLDMWRNLGYI